jgi:prepilin-type N-terminal cleavage/methylation domain-containing protein
MLPMSPGRNNAFTLFEMLVVIAIISILLIAVLPAFNSINAGRGIAGAVSEGRLCQYQ